MSNIHMPKLCCPLKLLFTSLLFSTVLLFFNQPILQAQITDEANSNSLMSALPSIQTEEEGASLKNWQGFGTMAIGLYLVGVSFTIFAFHRTRIINSLAMEVVVLSYIFWFILLPYTLWLLFKARSGRVVPVGE